MKIEKMGSSPPEVHKPSHRTKTAKKSILKLKGVSDPAATRKHTITMLTSKGARRQRRATRKRIEKMNKEEINKVAKNSNLKLNPSTPEDIKKQILYHGVSAGFISLD
jgi:hypothetical protein